MLASPGAAMALANRRLYDDLTGVDKLVTIFAAYYAPDTQSVIYANAGHSVAMYKPAGEPARILEATGMPLGIFDDADYEEQIVRLGPGDLLVVCSDGFPEANNQAEEMYGYDRLLAAVDGFAAHSAAEIGKLLSQSIAEFVVGHEQSDDQTIIVVKGKE